jgi:hypothetical protein
MEGNLVRVATFNINNINKRLDNLLAWLANPERNFPKAPPFDFAQGRLSRKRREKWGICKSFSLIDLSCLLA